MTAVGWIRPEYTVGVMLLRFLESYAHNIPDANSNVADISVQTITISDYSDKIHVKYPDPGGNDYVAPPDQTSLDTWSVVWYIASFGGLILFFLIVSCSEWCCRRSARRNCQINNSIPSTPQVPDSPPPSYDQFAPPAYEDLWAGSSRGRNVEKSEFDIYVVPVDALGTIMQAAHREDAPPSYQSASAGLTNHSDLPQVHLSSETSRIT